MLSAFIGALIALRWARRCLKTADLLVKTADILLCAGQRVLLIGLDAAAKIIALWLA